MVHMMWNVVGGAGGNDMSLGNMDRNDGQILLLTATNGNSPIGLGAFDQYYWASAPNDNAQFAKTTRLSRRDDTVTVCGPSMARTELCCRISYRS